MVINSLSNAAKSFTALIKQERIKLDQTPTQGGTPPREDFGINTWCTELFLELNSKFTSAATTAVGLSSTDKVNLLYLHAQFALYLLQNVFEFDSINQLIDSQSNAPLFQCESQASSDFNVYFEQLAQLTQSMTKCLHSVILNTSETATIVKNKDYTDTENKHGIQIFSNLVDLVGVLFLRVKSHTILR